MSEERKTLQQMVADAAGEDYDPWACPRCSCKDWRVVNTYMTAAGIRRRRVCRHCGQELMRTTEVPDVSPDVSSQ